MSIRNSVRLTGNVGQEPEVIKTTSGKAMCKINLATNDYHYDDNGNKIQNTEWHRVIVFGKRAEFVSKYVKAGHSISIEGRLQTRTYEPEGKDVKYITEIIVNDLISHEKKDN